MHSTTDVFIVETATPVTPQILLFEVTGGFPSAAVAATVKFAVEAIVGVQRFHFVDTGVKVVCVEPDLIHGEILRVFTAAGFADGSVRQSEALN